MVRTMEGLQIAFSIVGGLMLFGGLGVTAWRVSLYVRFKRRRATVVRYTRQRASRGSSSAKLTVRFEGEDGRSIEATDFLPWNRYHEGHEVTVLQVPDADPPRVVAPEFLRFWMLSLIFVPLGATFLYVAWIYVPSLG
jgi:hypothetical protein